MKNENRNAIRLEDIYNMDEALEYINQRLAAEGGRPLSLPGLRRHIYDDPARPGTLFQLEPIPLGRRVYDDYEKPLGLVFTRRMLDEYVANREHNARHGVARRVTRPTADELAAVLSPAEARARINEWLRRRGIKYRMTSATFNMRRHLGRIPHRVIGKVSVMTAADMDAVAHDVVRQLRGREQVQRGADRQPRSKRRPVTRADARRRAILKWGGVALPDETEG